MATVIEMPKLSDTMDSGTLINWLKKEGDTVESGEVIAEVESDKATMELESFESGVLRKVMAKAGTSVPVGGPLAILSKTADEDISAELARVGQPGGAPKAAAQAPAEAAPAEIKPAEAEPKPGSPSPQAPMPAEDEGETGRLEGPGPEPAAAPPRQQPAPVPREEVTEAEPAESTPGGHRISASPLAARMAQEWGLDVAAIKGSGPGGRVIKRDVEKAHAQGAAAMRPVGMIPSAPVQKFEHPEQEYEDIPNTQMRRIIAQRLSESKSQIPHYYVTIELDVRQALELRKQLNALEGVKVSLNDFVIKAAALALERHPLVNASYQGDHIRVYHRIDIGMAVAMEEGLITPVIRTANQKGLRQISEEARALAERARAKRLKPEEFTGSTFTVSNLGMLGVKHFTAVINPPEAAILAVGAAREIPVVENGALTIGHRMEVTVSSDHRVIDGAATARFLDTFKYFIENPIAFAL